MTVTRGFHFPLFDRDIDIPQKNFVGSMDTLFATILDGTMKPAICRLLFGKERPKGRVRGVPLGIEQ